MSGLGHFLRVSGRTWGASCLGGGGGRLPVLGQLTAQPSAASTAPPASAPALLALCRVTRDLCPSFWITEEVYVC